MTEFSQLHQKFLEVVQCTCRSGSNNTSSSDRKHGMLSFLAYPECKVAYANIASLSGATFLSLIITASDNCELQNVKTVKVL